MNAPLGPAAPGVIVSELDGSIALYDSGSCVHVLNDTASEVWRLLDGSRSLDDVVAVLTTRYRVEAGDIHDDVAAVVDVFRSQHLLASPPLDV